MRRLYHRVMQDVFDWPGWFFVEAGMLVDSGKLYSLGNWFYGRGHRHWGAWRS